MPGRTFTRKVFEATFRHKYTQHFGIVPAPNLFDRVVAVYPKLAEENPSRDEVIRYMEKAFRMIDKGNIGAVRRFCTGGSVPLVSAA